MAMAPLAIIPSCNSIYCTTNIKRRILLKEALLNGTEAIKLSDKTAVFKSVRDVYKRQVI